MDLIEVVLHPGHAVLLIRPFEPAVVIHLYVRGFVLDGRLPIPTTMLIHGILHDSLWETAGDLF